MLSVGIWVEARAVGVQRRMWSEGGGMEEAVCIYRERSVRQALGADVPELCRERPASCTRDEVYLGNRLVRAGQIGVKLCRKWKGTNAAAALGN
jgi:hypothetical protein